MNILVAVDKNWGIGYEGTQPVVIPEDRKRFRALTKGATVIVGRRTLMDFPGGKPLPNRRNLVLTRDPYFAVEGAEVVHSVDEAINAVAEDENVFVIGGDSVYRQLLPWCERAFVTKLDAAPPADRFFPDLDLLPGWRVEDPGKPLEHEGLCYRFVTYVRE